MDFLPSIKNGGFYSKVYLFLLKQNMISEFL